MKGRLLFCLVNLLFIASLEAQTLLTREAMNNFALFSSTGDIKKLEAARKNIDDAYKTRADSNAFRNNLIRSLVYVSLARVDSNLRQNYKKDPVEEVKFSMQKVYNSKSEDEFQEHIEYIEKQIQRIYLYRANTAFRERNFHKALNNYKLLDSIDSKNLKITHNLSVLYHELGYTKQAAEQFEKLIQLTPEPEYYLTLSNLYESVGEERAMIATLKKGALKFSENRDILFKLLNVLANKNEYHELINFVQLALPLDPENINLNYLAGYASEVTGDISMAEKYYKNILIINPNNYEANFALGLLYFESYLKDQSNVDLLSDAKHHLTTANEIDPYELKTLTSLSILYRYTDDKSEIQRINNRINQLKLN